VRQRSETEEGDSAVHVLSSAPPDSAWTFGGSILTFAFPMILFIAVAAALWVLYTKPELVPGRPVGDMARPVSYTPVPQQPAVAAGRPAAVGAGPAATSEGGAVATTGDGGAPATGETAAAPDGSAAASAGDGAAAVPEDDETAASGDGE
jgi:hypothetical protein